MDGHMHHGHDPGFVERIVAPERQIVQICRKGSTQGSFVPVDDRIGTGAARRNQKQQQDKHFLHNTLRVVIALDGARRFAPHCTIGMAPGRHPGSPTWTPAVRGPRVGKRRNRSEATTSSEAVVRVAKCRNDTEPFMGVRIQADFSDEASVSRISAECVKPGFHAKPRHAVGMFVGALAEQLVGGRGHQDSRRRCQSRKDRSIDASQPPPRAGSALALLAFARHCKHVRLQRQDGEAVVSWAARCRFSTASSNRPCSA